jgi:P pilus assembly chaperone PapD
MQNNKLKRAALCASLLATILTGGAQPIAAQGAGDLLVAPTRIELNGFRGTEVILNNIGIAKATYRISLEYRRMTPAGELIEVEEANITPAEKTAHDMIAFAPRRVTLEPNQPQAIRVGVRPPPDLPDGEYRVHMLFNAIPEAKPAGSAPPVTDGISIELRPIYGVTIPVFVRTGQLSAEVAIANARLVSEGERHGVAFDLTRSGNRSVFGDIRILKPGHSDPVIVGRGIAVYPEVERRSVAVAAPEGFTGTLAGPAKIQYVERTPEGNGRILAEAEVVLR